MNKIKTLLLSAILLFGFGQSVLADFGVPTNSVNAEISFVGKVKDIDLTKLSINENSIGDPIPSGLPIAYGAMSLSSECASSPENFFANNFDIGYVFVGALMPEGTSFDTNDDLNYSANFGDLNILCRYYLYIGLDTPPPPFSPYGVLRANRIFDFRNEVTLPPTVMLSPTSTISYIITPVISQITILTRNVLTDWWIYILVFGIVAIFMTKFRDLISIFTGRNKDPFGYNKQLDVLNKRNRSVRKWHKRAMQAYVRPKYGFESYKHEKKLPKKHRVYRGKD